MNSIGIDILYWTVPEDLTFFFCIRSDTSETYFSNGNMMDNYIYIYTHLRLFVCSVFVYMLTVMFSHVFVCLRECITC